MNILRKRKETWAILYLTNHLQVAGRISKEKIAGFEYVKMESFYVLGAPVPETHCYPHSSVFCVYVVDRGTAIAFARMLRDTKGEPDTAGGWSQLPPSEKRGGQ